MSMFLSFQAAGHARTSLMLVAALEFAEASAQACFAASQGCWSTTSQSMPSLRTLPPLLRRQTIGSLCSTRCTSAAMTASG